MKHKRRYYQLFSPTHSIAETDIKIERKKNEIKTAKMNEKKNIKFSFNFSNIKRYMHKLPRIQRNKAKSSRLHKIERTKIT